MDLPLPRKRKQARDVDDESAMENLPSHILMEIISRFPIKTVMALRCVSKSLFSLVSEPTFKKLYSTRAPTELLLRSCVKSPHADRYGYQPFNEHSSSTTLFIAQPVYKHHLHDSSYSTVDLKVDVMLDIPKFSVRPNNTLNFGATKTKLTLVNSCNGLVCYIGPNTNRFAVIINPFTGEYVTLPGPDRKDKALEGKDASYGFGFSPKDDKFKLLRLLRWESADVDPLTRGKRIDLIGEIYTFGESGSWKSVADCPNVYPPRNATFREGVLHWYWFSSIVTFDFDSERFGERFTVPRLYHLHTGVLGGYLYTTGRNGDGVVETWVMREYGRGSWANLFSLGKHGDSRSGANKPIKLLPTGEILMHRGLSDIACYNLKKRSVTLIGYFFRGCEVILIRPNLVSLEVMLGDMCVHTKVANTEFSEFSHWWTCSHPAGALMRKTPWNKGKEIVKPVTQELQASQAGSSQSLEASESTPIPLQSQVDVIEGVRGQRAGTKVSDTRNQSILDSEQRVGSTLTRSVYEECMQQVELLKQKIERLEEEGRQRDLQHLLALLQGAAEPHLDKDK